MTPLLWFAVVLYALIAGLLVIRADGLRSPVGLVIVSVWPLALLVSLVVLVGVAVLAALVPLPEWDA